MSTTSIRLAEDPVDFTVAEAVARVKNGPSQQDILPIHGSTSALQSTLVAGIRWSNGSSAQVVGAHTLIPICTAAAAAIDTFVNLFAAALKTVVFIPRAVVWLVTAGTQDIAEGANLADAVAHAAKGVGSAAMIVFGPLISLVSSKAALSFADSLHITGGLTKIDLGEKKETLMDGVRARNGILNKIGFLGKEIFNRGLAAPTKGVFKHTFQDRPGTTSTVLGLIGLSGAAYYAGVDNMKEYARTWLGEADVTPLNEEISTLKETIAGLNTENETLTNDKQTLTESANAAQGIVDGLMDTFCGLVGEDKCQREEPLGPQLTNYQDGLLSNVTECNKAKGLLDTEITTLKESETALTATVSSLKDGICTLLGTGNNAVECDRDNDETLLGQVTTWLTANNKEITDLTTTNSGLLTTKQELEATNAGQQGLISGLWDKFCGVNDQCDREGDLGEQVTSFTDGLSQQITDLTTAKSTLEEQNLNLENANTNNTNLVTSLWDKFCGVNEDCDREGNLGEQISSFFEGLQKQITDLTQKNKAPSIG